MKGTNVCASVLAAVSALSGGGVAVPAQHGAAHGAAARATRAQRPAQRLPAAFPHQPPAARQLPSDAGAPLTTYQHRFFPACVLYV